ncbi:MAG: PilC/PilY family type IV pilus protein [Burkholderiaceae bacterium]
MHSHNQRRPKPLQAIGLAIACLAANTATLAASTDIATAPLSTSSPTAVKPNIMFTLDDSGSMDREYMPDDMSSTGKYGYRSSQCNGVAYNPAITYALPVDSAGTSLAAGSLNALNVNTGALSNNRDVTSSTGGTTIGTGSKQVEVSSGTFPSYSIGETVTIYSSGNLGQWMVGTITAFSNPSVMVAVTATSGSGTLASQARIGRGDGAPYYYSYIGSQPKLGWTYNTSGVITSSDFYLECMSNVGSAPGSIVFTKNVVTSTSGPAGSPDERQNYANWYAYYRTRMDMMKSSVTLAFKGIGSGYRVGFNKISGTSVTGSSFLDIADFDTTQKASFYTKLNAATPGDSTPLRGALSKIGQYFAKKRSGQIYDPIQYSCQKNFHILSTDGYWNTGDESSSYGPKALDNSTDVGQQDHTAVRPMFDGANTTTTTTETWSTTSTTQTTVDQPQQQTSTQTTTTTTTTPTTWSRTNQALGTTNPNSTLTNSSISRSCSGSSPNISCTVTVTTSNNHGLSSTASNNTVRISGVTPAAYNGIFTPVTRSNSDTFTYTITGLSSNPATPTSGNRGNTVRTSSTYGFCPAGQGALTSTPQTGNGSTVSTSSAIVSTPANRTAQTVTTTTVVTPYTHTVVVVNGSTTSDSTTSGTPTTTNSSAAPTYTAGADGAPVNSTSSTGPTANQPSSWTNSGAATTSCASTAPAITPTQTGSGSPASNTGAPVTTTGSWSNNGSSTSSSGSPSTVTSAKTTSTATSTSGGSSDSLADIAMYYYKTDLRDASLSNCQGALGSGTNVCGNNVAPQGSDVATWQHMTTFTLGLGANGILKYDPNYLTQTTGDYNDLKQGTKDWPIPGGGKGAENIDDLWHAAVNGRGRYFSAGDPTTLASSLSGALASIVEKIGSASAAAASNLQPVAGDNKLFVAQYVSGKWTGDVLALTIDPETGVISPTVAWSAKQKLDARVAAGTARNIYYFKNDVSGNTGQLRAFTHANLVVDGLNGNVDNACSKSPALSQCASMNSTDIAAANLGTNMVSWLRGGSDANYRLRDGILGDIIGGAPIYVAKPPFRYTENAYAGFASSKSTRGGTLYVAANDGMLHAIDGATGEEKWAYMPAAVLPNLYKLADNNYAANHQFLVDGAPTIGDIYVPGSPGAWKTILIGGQGAGGRSYYALDITDPNAPLALWEFSHTNLGLTFGNPIITKRADGTWVVAFASGHNNNVGSGDGNGYLFMLNANTGAQLLTIPTYTTGTTPAGTPTTPSGLTKLNVWVDSEIDNTAKRFYGGDLLGNVWRFDIDSLVLPYQAAFRLAQLQISGVAQPITTQLALAEVTRSGTKYPIVYVTTGKYLGTSDLSNTATQSVYALKDPLTGTGLGDVRAGGTLVAQTLTDTTDTNGARIRTVTNNAVDLTVKNGWYVDLLSPGERVNVDPQLLLNTLTVAANIPSTDACTIGGESFLYRFDIGTGSSSPSSSSTVATWLGNTMVVGLTYVTLQKAGAAAGTGDTVTITVDNSGNVGTSKVPDPASSAGATKRTSWREIVN